MGSTARSISASTWSASCPAAGRASRCSASPPRAKSGPEMRPRRLSKRCREASMTSSFSARPCRTATAGYPSRRSSRLQKTLIVSLLWIALMATGCSTGPESTQASTWGNEVKLTLAAYTTPREAYAEIIPLSQAYWKDKTGKTVTFEKSYQGSGAQSRAVVEGFEADVVALSLEADVTRIEKAGLITHDWRGESHGGMVSTSVVAFAVRAGNPKAIHDWADLAGPGLEILTPNPKTSGGAMWNVLALYGAARRGHVAGYDASDEGAQKFLLSVLQNVTVMDKGA